MVPYCTPHSIVDVINHIIQALTLQHTCHNIDSVYSPVVVVSAVHKVSTPTHDKRPHQRTAV
eukprot:17578-Heterococcus_DN1.PRE.8